MALDRRWVPAGGAGAKGVAMRRWVVERRLIPGPRDKVAALLAHRMDWVRTPLRGEPDSWLDIEVRVEPGPDDAAWLTVIGAYPVPRTITGQVTDAGPLRQEAAETVHAVLDELSEEVLTVLAPLPGIAPFGEPRSEPLLVHDLMDPDVPAVDADLDLVHTACLLAAAGADGAPVVDATGRLLGVVSERDLLAGLLRDTSVIDVDAPALTAGDVCTRPAIVTVPGLTAARAAQQMLYHGIRRLAVVQDGRLIGTVTRHALYEGLRAGGTRARTHESSLA